MTNAASRSAAIVVVPVWRPFPPKHSLGLIVAPQIGRPQVAERDLGGFVPGLAHQLGEPGALIAGGGGEAGAQRVPGIPLRIEAGVDRVLLDQAGDRLVGKFLPGNPAAGLGDGAEQRAAGVRRGAGGPVEVLCGAAMHQPGVEGGEGAEARLRWVGPDRDFLALALLVSVEAAHQHPQAAAGDGLDVTQGERHQLRAAQRGVEAEQQHRTVARS